MDTVQYIIGGKKVNNSENMTQEYSLKPLPKTHSCGPDEIDGYILNVANDNIANPLLHIVNLSIKTGVFPDRWKLARISPLHKKESKLLPKNDRPVALLCILSKVLEKVVHMQLIHHFESNNLLSKSQHAFRKNRSTQTALATMHDRWCRAAENGKLTGILLVDLSAAFDVLSPDILLDKHSHYGLDLPSLLWFSSYLHGRSQYVQIGAQKSSNKKLKYGVPQGSILGPLLFIIYMNDIQSSLQHCTVESFADDTTMEYSDENPQNIGDIMQLDALLLEHWLQDNELVLSGEKSRFIMAGTQSRLSANYYKFLVIIRLTEEIVPEVEFEKLLGITISNDLKWENHIVCKDPAGLLGRLAKRVGMLKRVSSLVHYRKLLPIIHGIFMSTLVYGISVYGGTTKKMTACLQVLQNKTARLYTRLPKMGTSISKLLGQADFLSVHQLSVYHSLVQYWKIRKFKSPEYLYERILNIDQNRNQNYTRIDRVAKQKNRENQNSFDLVIMKNSFVCRTKTYWVQLPQNIKNECQSIKSLKTAVKKWVKKNIPIVLKAENA